jgi:hypothetical protein
LAQNVEVAEPELKAIINLVKEFHAAKDIVHEKEYRSAKGWKIPKLELQHHIVPSIMSLGNLMGASTDISEHEHVQLIKEPFCHTNHWEFHQQMVSYLNWMERIQYFDLVTALTTESVGNAPSDLSLPSSHTSNTTNQHQGETNRIDSLAAVQNLQGGKHPTILITLLSYKPWIQPLFLSNNKIKFTPSPHLLSLLYT